MRIKLEAHAFTIWRYCERHGWDMTYQEVADATGLTIGNVCDVIVRKGWKGKLVGFDRSANARRASAISCFRRGSEFNECDLDLVDLFA